MNSALGLRQCLVIEAARDINHITGGHGEFERNITFVTIVEFLVDGLKRRMIDRVLKVTLIDPPIFFA